MNTLVWIGFTQSLFAALLMFTKKNNSLPDRILSGWLTLLAIEFLTCGLDHSIYGEPLLSSSFLLFNPALFIYVSSLTRSEFRLKWLHLLHLLPFVVFESLAYIIKEPFNPHSFFQHDDSFWFRMAFSAANILSWVIYNPLTLILVHRHRMLLKDEHSNIEKNENLGWLLTLAIFYFVYCVAALGISLIVIIGNSEAEIPHIYNYATLLLLVFMLSFYGLMQQELKTRYITQIKKKAYINSHLTEVQKKKISAKIIQYLEKERAYLNPDLNMETLAQAIKVPKYQITEVLNTSLGKNFFQFVNGYRVEAVKKMLADPDNKYSIEAIGYDCGFSSKSVFFAVFKKETGMTPKQFTQN